MGMIHRGLKVAQVLVRKGIDLSKLSQLVDLTEDHLYVLLGDRFLEYDIIDFIGKKVGHGFSDEFPEMNHPKRKCLISGTTYRSIRKYQLIKAYSFIVSVGYRELCAGESILITALAIDSGSIPASLCNSICSPCSIIASGIPNLTTEAA